MIGVRRGALGARRDQLTGYFLIFPVMAFLVLFVFYPAIWTLLTSFTSYNLIIPFTHTVGLSNYATLLTSNEFWTSVKRTFIVVAISLPLDIGIGLIAALTLNEPFPGRGLVRVLLLIPWALPPIVNGYMWNWILDGDFGALNGLLYQLGIIHNYVHWLSDPTMQLVWVS